jgi:hypothetical protein
VRRRGPLDEIADELYSGLPAEFTVARNAASHAARNSGDVELAGALHRMHKPTVAAWLANLLVRDQPHEIAHLVALGTALRKAQAAFDGEALRRLSEQRHGVVRGLSQGARRLADERGQKLSDAVLRELEATLEAAVFDPDAAEQLQRGRLTGALAYSGIGFPSPPLSSTSSSSSSSSSSPSVPSVLAEPRGRSSPGGSHHASRSEHAQGRRGDANSKATSLSSLREVEREARRARRAAEQAAAALEGAERASVREKAVLSVAEKELARRREASRDAQRVVTRARAARDAAEREARRAERRAEAARRKEPQRGARRHH